MSAVFWFWTGIVIGSFVGFGCFCLLQAAHDPSRGDAAGNDVEVSSHAQH